VTGGGSASGFPWVVEVYLHVQAFFEREFYCLPTRLAQCRFSAIGNADNGWWTKALLHIVGLGLGNPRSRDAFTSQPNGFNRLLMTSITERLVTQDKPQR